MTTHDKLDWDVVRPAIERTVDMNLTLVNMHIEERRADGMLPFYFTYGSYRNYPFQGGWTIVLAVDLKNAVQKFRVVHPDFHDNTVNCASFYTEEQWMEDSDMWATGNLGKFAQELID